MRAASFAGLGLVLSGCATGTPEAVVTMTSPATVTTLAGPLDPSAVVLTLTGPGVSLQLDVAAIEQLTRYELQLYEPFLETMASFEAVAVEELLLATGVLADTVTMTALDDYVVRFEGDAWREGGWLATSSGGQPIPVSEGGPLRLVFTGGPVEADPDRWIWSVVRMDAR